MNVDRTVNTTDRIVQQLELTKKDIEEFLVDLNLENTNVEERYDKLKEELSFLVKEIKESINSKDIITEEMAEALQVKLSVISEHLRRPNRNTVFHISQFVRAIKGVMKAMANALPNDGSTPEVLENIHDRLQCYRLKFQILKLRLALGKLKLKYAREEMQYSLNQKINELSSFVNESKYGAEKKLRKCRTMANKIYSDISKIYT